MKESLQKEVLKDPGAASGLGLRVLQGFQGSRARSRVLGF